MTNLIIDSTVANPSINLAALNVPTTVVVSNTTVAAHIPSMDELKSLEIARISWETTELAQSNNRLYSILHQAYQYYLLMKRDPGEGARKDKLAAMEAFIAERGYTFTPSTHDMTRVVKCVFGVDRRRVSAYSIALREALRQDVAADDLVEFLEQNGGVEQIRLGGTKPLSVTKRAELGKAVVGDASLGTIEFDSAVFKAEEDWVDKQVVLVATCLSNGQLEVKAVIRHDGAVNMALAAHFSLAQAKGRQAESTMKKAIVEAEAEAKRKVREESAQAKAFIKAFKVPKKKLTKEEREALALQMKKDIAE
ncbi:MAG: hypothetical protein WCP25_10205, partial [Polynucleobacter sp.]